MGGWRSIETAPKDGTSILTWNGETYCIDHYEDGAWANLGISELCKTWIDTPGLAPPTHWMPLPNPPKD